MKNDAMHTKEGRKMKEDERERRTREKVDDIYIFCPNVPLEVLFLTTFYAMSLHVSVDIFYSELPILFEFTG